MRHLPLALLLTLALTAPVAGQAPMTLDSLGERLFFDVNLSANRTQSCASCHDPDHAFADPRGMASPGDDGLSLGDRNAPSAMYAALTLPFHRERDGRWRGGQFLDGRAATLEQQAAGPPLNPAEMGMADAAAVVARLREDRLYTEAFGALFGADVLDDANRGYAAMTRAIAAYERTATLAPFTSRYDRALRGEIVLSDEEELGRLLFFSQQFTNCTLCHQARASQMAADETFSDGRYYNIGVPVNGALRSQNGVAGPDDGLAANPAVQGDPTQRGRFRTPTLRNVAVTGPYMHNGVFADLRSVILFYNSYNARNPARQVNPETGERFAPPEVPGTLALDHLTHGPALDDRRIDALVAFLRALTDERYESLLAE